MFLKKLTLLVLFVASFFINEANLWSNNVPTTQITPPGCDIPAPATFVVTEIGTDYVALQWSASSPQPAFYRIKTFVAATNAQVSNLLIPGWMTLARVNNLTPGETYYSRITPVCAEGDESTSSKESAQYTTIIGDLIVTGFQGTNSNTIDCAINNQNMICQLTTGVLHEFRVKEKQSQLSRRFGVVYEAGTFETQLSSNGNTGENFKLYCEINTAPSCTGAKKVTIMHGTTQVAQFSVLTNETNNSLPFLKCLTINQLYDFEKIAPNSMLPGGNNTAADPAFGKQQQLQPGVSPVPFTDYLHVSLGSESWELAAQITLYDAQGKLLLSIADAAAGQTHTLPTQTLRPGIYFVRVETGKHTQVYKVIKTE